MKLTIEIDSLNRQSIRKAIRLLENLLDKKPEPQWRVQKWVQKIQAIRIIREYSLFGLKEAKELADGAEMGWVSFEAPTKFFEAIQGVSEGLEIRGAEPRDYLAEDDEEAAPVV